MNLAVLQFSHNVSCESDFPEQFLVAVLTPHLSSHMAVFIPLMFSLQNTDILTGV